MDMLPTEMQLFPWSCTPALRGTGHCLGSGTVAMAVLMGLGSGVAQLCEAQADFETELRTNEDVETKGPGVPLVYRGCLLLPSRCKVQSTVS